MPRGIYIRTEAIKKSLSIAGKGSAKKHSRCDKCGSFQKEGHICPSKEEIIERTRGMQTPEAIEKRTNIIIEKIKQGEIIPHWKGKKRDNSTKEKISETKKLLFELGLHNPSNKKGVRTNTGRTLFKKGVYAGEKHWNWKGGISSKRKKLWSSGDYQNWRKAVFERDNYTCQIENCKERLLNAHHIKEIYKYPELIFNIDNGKTLCAKHHKELHGLNKK